MPHDHSGEPAYEIGYGKPPRFTRFKPGVSGNPRGRPKHAKNLSTLVHEALNEQIVVAENGGRRRISKRQAITKQLVNRSAQGDLKVLQMLLGIIQDIEQRSAAAAVEPTFDAPDEKVIEQLKSRLGTGSGF